MFLGRRYASWVDQSLEMVASLAGRSRPLRYSDGRTSLSKCFRSAEFPLAWGKFPQRLMIFRLPGRSLLKYQKNTKRRSIICCVILNWCPIVWLGVPKFCKGIPIGSRCHLSAPVFTPPASRSSSRQVLALFCYRFHPACPAKRARLRCPCRCPGAMTEC